MRRVAFAVCLVALAGCGGGAKGRPLSASEYAQAASRICIRGQAAGGNHKTLEALSALKPTSSVAPRAHEWLSVLQELRRLDAVPPRNLRLLLSLNREGQRLAAELDATGCLLSAQGEGYGPYPLHRVESMLRAQKLRYVDPFRLGDTFATGWTAYPPCAFSSRPLNGVGWTIALYRSARLARRAAACLAGTETRGRDYVLRGNVFVAVQRRSLIPRLRRALSSLH